MPLSKQDLAVRAFQGARNVLHRHVGKQDEYAAALGGLNFIEFLPGGRTRGSSAPREKNLAGKRESSRVAMGTSAGL
jgi:D-glycero-alpha-D-manno-heptose-7-phosphate kinase